MLRQFCNLGIGKKCIFCGMLRMIIYVFLGSGIGGAARYSLSMLIRGQSENPVVAMMSYHVPRTLQNALVVQEYN